MVEEAFSKHVDDTEGDGVTIESEGVASCAHSVNEGKGILINVGDGCSR